MLRMCRMVLHLECEMNAIILKIMRFATMNESANALVLSMTFVSRTLIDLDGGRVLRLRATLPGEQRCLCLFGGISCLGEPRKDEVLESTKVLGVVLIRLSGRRGTGADDADEHFEQAFDIISLDTELLVS